MNYFIDLFLQKQPRLLNNPQKTLVVFVSLEKLILRIKNVAQVINLSVR
jgi:hypothetical protein